MKQVSLELPKGCRKASWRRGRRRKREHPGRVLTTSRRNCPTRRNCLGVNQGRSRTTMSKSWGFITGISPCLVAGGAGEAEVLEVQRRESVVQSEMPCLATYVETAKEMLLEKILGNYCNLEFPHLWVCSSALSGGLGPLLASTRKKSWMQGRQLDPRACGCLSLHTHTTTAAFRQKQLPLHFCFQIS